MVMKLATPQGGIGGVSLEGARHQILKCEHEMSPEAWISEQVPIPIAPVCVMCLCCLVVCVSWCFPILPSVLAGG